MSSLAAAICSSPVANYVSFLTRIHKQESNCELCSKIKAGSDADSSLTNIFIFKRFSLAGVKGRTLLMA